MTLMVKLSPKAENALRERAARAGRDASDVASELLEQTVLGPSLVESSFERKLDLLARLQADWNGHRAPPPNESALAAARHLLIAILATGREPTRLVASAVGGVAITFRRGDRKVMVECLNTGVIHALFADDATQTMNTKPVEAAAAGYDALLANMRSYLDG